MLNTINRLNKFLVNMGLMKSSRGIVIAAAIFTGGCCSIVSSKSAGVSISATPPEASILVIDLNQMIIIHRIKGTGIVMLNGMTANHQCARYQVYAFAKNYLPSTAILTAERNPWMAGNIVFVIGLIACRMDELNGTAYQIPAKPLCLNLRPLTDDADEMKIPEEKEFYEKARNFSSEDFEKAFIQRIEAKLTAIRAQMQKVPNQ